MMAVFSAVAAVGTSIVLGAGFERLRCGFEIVRKQTGFFSDAIHKLEQKVEIVDQQTSNFTHSINTLEAKVVNVGEQAGAFSSSIQKLEQKVDIVDKQTGFFSDSLYKLEKTIETIGEQEKMITEKLQQVATHSDLISAAESDTLGSESLLIDMQSPMVNAQNSGVSAAAFQELRFNIPPTISANEIPMDGKAIRYH
jgi:septal ring factor EnvC (AmiA/AmiB activator)